MKKLDSQFFDSVCYSAPQTKKNLNELTRKEKREEISNKMRERGVKN